MEIYTSVLSASESSDTLVVKDGHNIDCKVTGAGAIKLKQEFVKKS
jgi:uncharacterized Zn ribbon protein